MPQYTVKLNKREVVAEGTLAFYFDKPADFAFKAGQYLELILTNPPETDAEGNSRALSIASAPSESHLMVATRMRSTAFKRVLGKLPLGAEVQIEEFHSAGSDTVFCEAISLSLPIASGKDPFWWSIIHPFDPVQRTTGDTGCDS